MSDFHPRVNDSDIFTRRALARLTEEERERQRQADALEAQKREEASRAAERQRALFLQDVGRRLAELQPLYAARSEAVRKLAGPLAEFMQAERELVERENRLAENLGTRDGGETWRRLRTSAGLPANHADLGAVRSEVDRMTRMVGYLLASGVVNSAGVTVGDARLAIEP